MGGGQSTVRDVHVTPAKGVVPDSGAGGPPITPARQLQMSSADEVGRPTWEYVPVGAPSHSWTAFEAAGQERLEAGSHEHKAEVTVMMGKRVFTAALAEGVMRNKGTEIRVRRRLVDPEPIPTFADAASPSDGTAGANESMDPTGKRGRFQATLAASVSVKQSIVYCAAFSKTGNTVLTGGRDGSLRHWEVDTGYVAHDYVNHDGIVLSCALASNAPLAASGCNDRVVRLFSTGGGGQSESREDGAVQATRCFEGHTHKVYGVGFFSDDRRIASVAMDKLIRVWDAETGSNVFSAKAHTGAAFTVACSPFSPHICVSGGDDHALVLYDTRLSGGRTSDGPSGAGTSTIFRGHNSTIWSCDIAFDERLLVTGAMDGRALLWDARQPARPLRVVANHNGHEIHHTEFMPDARQILTSARDGSWQMWSLTGQPGAPAASLDSEAPYSEEEVAAGAAAAQDESGPKPDVATVSRVPPPRKRPLPSPQPANGEASLTGSPEFDRLPNPEASARLMMCRRAHSSVVFRVTYCAMRQQILSCGSDGHVKLWTLEPGAVEA